MDFAELIKERNTQVSDCEDNSEALCLLQTSPKAPDVVQFADPRGRNEEGENPMTTQVKLEVDLEKSSEILFVREFNQKQMQYALFDP